MGGSVQSLLIKNHSQNDVTLYLYHQVTYYIPGNNYITTPFTLKIRYLEIFWTKKYNFILSMTCFMRFHGKSQRSLREKELLNRHIFNIRFVFNLLWPLLLSSYFFNFLSLALVEWDLKMQMNQLLMCIELFSN